MREEFFKVNLMMVFFYNFVMFILIIDDFGFLKFWVEEFLRFINEVKKEIGNIGSELIDNGDIVIIYFFFLWFLKCLFL